MPKLGILDSPIPFPLLFYFPSTRTSNPKVHEFCKITLHTLETSTDFASLTASSCSSPRINHKKNYPQKVQSVKKRRIIKEITQQLPAKCSLQMRLNDVIIEVIDLMYDYKSIQNTNKA